MRQGHERGGHARCAPRWGIACALAASAAPQLHAGEPPPAPATLDRIQVTATRVPLERAATAATIDTVQGDALRADTAGVALSDLLSTVPGVLARTRQNFAQDEQVSIRGFGTRAAFGIRGVRLYIDGVPATLPDGQGQVAHFPLDAAERIEVLRGPFSALYGNAAGGVIQLFTRDGREPDSLTVSAAAGSWGQRRVGAQAQGVAGGVAYAVSAGHFRTDGWREHSRASRDSLYAKASMPLGEGRLTLLADLYRMPLALDPQGLTREQAGADPRQASAGARLYDTRKSARQSQLAAIYERSLGPVDARLLAYGGQRSVWQVLSIPAAVQRANPLSGGGVIDFDAPFAGLDARVSLRRGEGVRPFDVVAGLGIETVLQQRSGYENFAGDRLGVRGALRLRQDDRVTSIDPYIQGNWAFTDAWTLSAGLRHSRVTFESRDHYVTVDNPDDSGRVRHSATLPALGLTWRPRPALSWYAAWGKGFETPTFNELGYRRDGGSGLNFALRPMRTRSVETGLRWEGDAVQASLVAFRTASRDELAVNGSMGGRSTYQNTGRALRRGVEASAALPLGAGWRAGLAATWLDAHTVDAHRACTGIGCEDAPIVPAGTRLPGVPRRQAALSLHRGDGPGWQPRLSLTYVGEVTANQAGDARAGSLAMLDASLGYGFRRGRAFVGIDNLLDRRGIGSVIVNEGNGRYYEPAPGRSIVAGVELRFAD